jgi:hypothetical protein
LKYFVFKKLVSIFVDTIDIAHLLQVTFPNLLL